MMRTMREPTAEQFAAAVERALAAERGRSSDGPTAGQSVLDELIALASAVRERPQPSPP